MEKRKYKQLETVVDGSPERGESGRWEYHVGLDYLILRELPNLQSSST